MIVIPSREELTPKPIATGIYKATVTDMKLEKTKETGKDMIVAELTIQTQGPNPPDMKVIGRKLFDNLVVDEKTMWKVSSFLKACTGRDIVDHFGQGEEMGIDPFYMKYSNLCINKEVVLVVTTEKYEGNDVNRVKEVREVKQE